MIPIVPGAICFDLFNGGDKKWGRFAPYRDLGYVAAAAAGTSFALGSVGAGLGATMANLKGGLGSASAATAGGVKVAALAVVNAVGSVTVGDGPWFWAAPFEVDGEFGGRGMPPAFTPDMLASGSRAGPPRHRAENTTLAVVVTDAVLTKAQAKRLAMIAQTGFARAIYPVHAPLDGDVVFAAATGEKADRSAVRADRTRHGRGQCHRARDRARRACGDRAALPRRPARVEGSLRIVEQINNNLELQVLNSIGTDHALGGDRHRLLALEHCSSEL